MLVERSLLCSSNVGIYWLPQTGFAEWLLSLFSTSLPQQWQAQQEDACCKRDKAWLELHTELCLFCIWAAEKMLNRHRPITILAGFRRRVMFGSQDEFLHV